MTNPWKELMSKDFGDMLAKHRKRKKLSIRKLSSLAGVSASYLSYIERGIHGPPSSEVTIKLAEALDADKDEFLAKAGHVSREVSEAYQKNPKEISSAMKKTSSSKWLGLVFGFLLMAALMKDEPDQEEEEEDFSDPEGAYKQLKEAYLNEDSPITKERKYFEYYSALVQHWKTDLEQREKEKK